MNLEPPVFRCHWGTAHIKTTQEIKNITISVSGMTSNMLSCLRVSLMNLSFSGHMSGQVPTNTLDMSRSVLFGRPVRTDHGVFVHAGCWVEQSRGRRRPHLDAGPCLSVPGGGISPQLSQPPVQSGRRRRKGPAPPGSGSQLSSLWEGQC